MIQIDVIHSQAAQTGAALLHNMFARKPAIIWSFTHRKIHFGGQNKGVSRKVFQGPTDNLFGRALVIHVGCIKEVDADVVGLVDTLNGGLFSHRTAIGQPTA
jgi:hypothetical protein